MTVGLLIITHDRVGEELLNTSTTMLQTCPLRAIALEVSSDSDPDALIAQASAHLEKLDQGDGVLVLTDVYGSTPSNIANRLTINKNVQVVAGVNLPMLIRVLNYPRLSLSELARKALSGGRDGILLCKPNQWE